MSFAVKKHFDVLEFVKTSKALGVNEELAVYQAKQLVQVIDIAASNTKEEFDMRELATKADLRELRSEVKSDIHELRSEVKGDIHELNASLVAKIERYRFDTLKFVIWTGVGGVVFLAGLLAKGFHWFG